MLMKNSNEYIGNRTRYRVSPVILWAIEFLCGVGSDHNPDSDGQRALSDKLLVNKYDWYELSAEGQTVVTWCRGHSRTVSRRRRRRL